MIHVAYYVNRPYFCRKVLEKAGCICTVRKENKNWILDVYARPQDMASVEKTIAAYV